MKPGLFLSRSVRMLACALCLGGVAQAADTKAAAPTPIIFDTDMYSDIDDMLALGMLNTLSDRGEIKLLAVTSNTEAKWIPPYIDAVNTYYGRGGIPIGMVRGGVTDAKFADKPQPYSPGGINYTRYIAELRAGGQYVYPHKLVDGDKAEEAVHLLRRTLAAQPDGSVVLVGVGYLTNLARLLDSKADAASPLDGRALAKAKIKKLVLMAGSFGAGEYKGAKVTGGRREFNIFMDVPASQKVVSQWPTPIFFSGFEIGFAMRMGETEFANAFNYTKHHPIAETFSYLAPSYRAADKTPNVPHEHATYDLTAVLYAARPDAGYFSLSAPGNVVVQEPGITQFTADKAGTRQYMTVTPEQKVRVLEAMTMLVTQPPAQKAGR